MLGFGIVFVAATIAFTLVIQGFYHKQALFKQATVADEIIGGLLGVVAGAVPRRLRDRHPGLVLPAPGASRRRDGELPFLRELLGRRWTRRRRPSCSASRLIPGFIQVFGLLIPQDLQALYVGR